MTSEFTFVNEPCCICRHSESKLLYEIYYPQHKYPGKFVLRRCCHCRLIFNSPRLNERALRNLYNENYYFFHREASAELERMADVYARTVALVEKDIRDRRVLEIGSGKGYLLALLKKMGWDVQGVEISPSAANYSREKFNIRVFNGSLEEYDFSFPDTSYSLVLAIDLIEHVPDPRRFMEVLKGKVEKKGLLILDTPNGDAHNISIWGSKWKGFNPFHLYIFDIANLTSLLNDNGFQVLKAFSYGNSPSHPVEESVIIENLTKKMLKNALNQWGLLSFARRIYRKLQYIPREPDLDNFLSAIIGRIQKKTYFDTPDSQGELAVGMKGDNFVVIAEKK